MIPREILKKIRLIEIRTNYIATELAERGSVSNTSRSILEFFNTLADYNALRLDLRSQPRSGREISTSRL